jgi:hypothetical protein
MTALLFAAFLITMAIGVPIAVTLGLSTLLAILSDGRFPAMLVPQKLFAGRQTGYHPEYAAGTPPASTRWSQVCRNNSL